MAMLLADVGGTNARLALAHAGKIDPVSITRFRGEDYADFDSVVTTYLQQQSQPALTAVCVAVAGPVAGGQARLTNRDWSFDQTGLARLTGVDRVRLINDLTALGYATAMLGDDGYGVLRAVDPARSRNGQGLVVNAGTGFNVCSVRHLSGGGVICLEHEEGHTVLPGNIQDRLRAALGPAAAGFPTTEDLFAGRGLSRLHAALHGTEPVRSEEIARALEGGDAAALRTYRFYAELFGLLCRELALRFMPLEGLYLAGSVARSVNRQDLQSIFIDAMMAEPFMRAIPANVPILVIRDDMAALSGCVAALT
ncbi:glucokinase [Paracoccus pacificus]|uniref:Glucokinase n=1 Tax=Paracoccus pacificus TaxID=1463598 RepID=A0ABW4R807_9RHOB